MTARLRGVAYDHIHLLDANTGEAVAAPFVVIEQELWDSSQQRFTLLFDPGRITVEHAETYWRFTPDTTRAPGSYFIDVDAILEDLAGNNLRHVFDVRTRAFAL